MHKLYWHSVLGTPSLCKQLLTLVMAKSGISDGSQTTKPAASPTAAHMVRRPTSGVLIAVPTRSHKLALARPHGHQHATKERNVAC